MFLISYSEIWQFPKASMILNILQLVCASVTRILQFQIAVLNHNLMIYKLTGLAKCVKAKP